MPINYPTYSDPWIEMSVENSQILVQRWIDDAGQYSIYDYNNKQVTYSQASKCLLTQYDLANMLNVNYYDNIFFGYLYFANETRVVLKVESPISNVATLDTGAEDIQPGFYPVLFNLINQPIADNYVAFVGYKFDLTLPTQNRMVARIKTNSTSTAQVCIVNGNKPITVNWGDGSIETISGLPDQIYPDGTVASHTYSDPGEWNITVFSDNAPTGYYLGDDLGIYITDFEFYNPQGVNYVSTQAQLLSVSNVNSILIMLDGLVGLPGTVFLNTDSGNHAPTGDGLKAKDSLIAKGWYVYTD